MDYAQTFAPNTKIASVFLNLLQLVTTATRSTTGYLSAMPSGVEARVWHASSDLTSGAIVIVDGGAIDTVNTGTDPATTQSSPIDWSDREVLGFYRAPSCANQLPGQSDDYQFDAAGAPTLFWGYLGLGALNGAGGAVSAGNPPVRASGSSWAAEIVSNLWLYLDAADGKLKLYNATGGTLRTPTLWFFATAQTGKRP